MVADEGSSRERITRFHHADAFQARFAAEILRALQNSKARRRRTKKAARRRFFQAPSIPDAIFNAKLVVTARSSHDIFSAAHAKREIFFCRATFHCEQSFTKNFGRCACIKAKIGRTGEKIFSQALRAAFEAAVAPISA